MLCAGLFEIIARADTIELQEVSVVWQRYFPGGVDPLVTENSNLPNRTLGNNLQLNVNTNILKYLYWNSRIHASTDQVLNIDGSTSGGQFRTVGLEFGLGVNLTKNIQFGYHHHSQHILDSSYGNGPFPREDSLELKIWLYKAKKESQGLF